MTATKDAAGLKDLFGFSDEDINPPNPDLWFWDSTPLTRHVHQYALQSMIQPWALLVHVLVNISARIPIGHTLPPLSGSSGHQPINLFAVFVAGSGGGKDMAKSKAAAAVTFPGEGYETEGGTAEIPELPLGSAEGMVKVFRRFRAGKPAGKGANPTPEVPPGPVWVRHAAILSLDESNSLERLSQQSPDLLNQLKSAWSGGTLGYARADETKAVTVPSMSYRLGMKVSAQPTQLGTILSGSEDGFLQRWLWVPTAQDQWNLDDPDDLTDTPEPIEWLGINYPPLKPGEVVPFQVPAWFMREMRLERMNESRDTFADRTDGHRMQLIERVACTFAAAESRLDVSDLDIALARRVVERGEELRTEVLEELKRRDLLKRNENNRRAAEDNHDVSERLEEIELNRRAALATDIPALVDRHSRAGDPWVRVSLIRSSVTGSRAPYVDKVVDILVDLGTLVTEERVGGNRRKAMYVRRA